MGIIRAVVDGVPAKPLHSYRASAQDTSIHVPADPSTCRPLRFRLRADTLPQDGLSCPPPCHAAHTVTTNQLSAFVIMGGFRGVSLGTRKPLGIL